MAKKNKKKTLADLIQEKLSRLDSVPDRYISAAERAQKQFLKDILKQVDDLEVKGGQIVKSRDNLRKVEVIYKKIRTAFLKDSDFLKATLQFVDEFSGQAALTDEYFSREFNSYKPTNFYKAVFESSQKRTLELLTQSQLEAQVLQPVKEIMRQSVTTGMRFQDAVKLLNRFMAGNDEVDGALARHAKRIAYDSFAQSDREYTNTIATAIGVEFYRYSGGTIKDTRDFCAQRNGKFYHIKEIEKWANQDWAGKISATNKDNIFVLAGGYNCKHSFIPVSEFGVPEEVKKRAEEKGYYKPEK